MPFDTDELALASSFGSDIAMRLKKDEKAKGEISCFKEDQPEIEMPRKHPAAAVVMLSRVNAFVKMLCKQCRRPHDSQQTRKASFCNQTARPSNHGCEIKSPHACCLLPRPFRAETARSGRVASTPSVTPSMLVGLASL